MRIKTKRAMGWMLLWAGRALWAQDPLLEPESYVERVRREGSILDLSLRDAIRLALVNNLEIAIEEFNEDLNRERFTVAEGFYDPVLNFTFGVQSDDTLSTSVLTAGSGIETFSRDQFVWNNSVDQNVPGGGNVLVSLNNGRSETNSVFSTINPQFASNFNIDFTQPLWRGFQRTETDRQMKLINLDSRITESQFKQRVSEVVQQVENQYWELVFTIENHETRRQSMQLAVIQHANNTKRVEIGVLAPIEITSARAEVAAREQEMIQAEVQIVGAQNALKRLLASDPRDSIWNLTLIPSDRPDTRPVDLDLEQAIQTALARRPEMEQIQLEMEKNEVDQAYFLNGTKPTVNVRLNFGSSGRSGTVFQTVPILNDEGVPVGQQRVIDPDSPAAGNFGESFSQIGRFEFNNWGVFADVRIPLRNRSNEGQLAQVQIARARLLSQVKNQQQMIMVDVRNAYQSMGIQKKRLEAARIARQLAEEQLDGENKRFEAGLSTNFEVLRFQRDLAEARVQELRALVDFQLALTALEKAMYTIIDDSHIVLAKE